MVVTRTACSRLTHALLAPASAPLLPQTLSVVERLEAAGLNVICDAKRQLAEREKYHLEGTHHHDFAHHDFVAA